jgi:hypothetical protein
VPERSVDRVRVSTTDPRGLDSATKLYNLFAICLKKGRPQRDAAAQRIQDVNWQLLGRLGREIVEFGASGVPGESFHLGESSDGSIAKNDQLNDQIALCGEIEGDHQRIR